MANRFSSTVRPSGVDPLAEAINSLRGSYSSAAEGQRQKGIEDEDRDLMREDRATAAADRARAQEIQDVTLARSGVRRGSAPTQQVDIGDDDTLVAAARAARAAGRPPAPKLEIPAAFRPGQGFALPDFSTMMQPPAAPPAIAQPPEPSLGERFAGTPTRETADPRYDQLSENYYLDEEGTPEARARAVREQERSELEEALAGLGHIGPAGARAMARGAPASVAAPDPYGGFRDRDQYIEDEGAVAGARRAPPDPYDGRPRDQYLEDIEAEARARATGSGKTGGMEGVDPTTNAVTLRTRAMGAAGAISRIDAPRTERQKAAYEQQRDRVLRAYGFESEDELFDIASSLGIMDEEGNIQADPVESTIAELEEQGITDPEAIIAELVKRGLIDPEE